jgi:hypothetical protein
MPSVDMPSTAAMKDSNSAEGAPSVKDATKEVTKDAAKEAAKKKLKGIFKR